jgi:hypothetical protein
MNRENPYSNASPVLQEGRRREVVDASVQSDALAAFLGRHGLIFAGQERRNMTMSSLSME